MPRPAASRRSGSRPISPRDGRQQPLGVVLFRRRQNLRRAGLSYVFISHDLAVVRFISDEVLVMKDGVVVEQASAAQILAAPKEDYTKRLLAAIPRGYRAAA